jgi:hypothetical protein
MRRGFATHSVPPWNGVNADVVPYTSRPYFWLITFTAPIVNGAPDPRLGAPVVVIAGTQPCEFVLAVQYVCGPAVSTKRRACTS